MIAALPDATLSTADLLRPFATLGELGRGLTPGHSDRACLIAMAIADRMGLDEQERDAVLATSLLFHAGCTAGVSQFAAFIAADELRAQHDLWLCDSDNLSEVLGWARRNVAVGQPIPVRIARVLQFVAQGEATLGEFFRGCYDVGARVAARLGLSAEVQSCLRHVCETWHGKGPLKIRGASIPLPTRIVQVAMLAEVFATDSGPDRARDVARRYGGKAADPDVARAFLNVAARASFWEDLQGPLAGRVLDLGRAVGSPGGALVDELVRTMADVVDLKSPDTASHSRSAGTLVSDVATELGFSVEEATLATRAAWAHDVGKVGIACALLERRGTRTRLDDEFMRTHIAYSERIVGSSQALQDLLPLVRSHHERPDGSGPHGERDNSLAVRVVATVDDFLEDRDARTGPPSERAADALRALRQRSVDGTCLDALEAVVARAGGRRAPRGPANLSEREQEILALVARGLTNKEIARELHVSPHTVRHHLEHVYEKIDVISRAGATLFAVEHGYA